MQRLTVFRKLSLFCLSLSLLLISFNLTEITVAADNADFQNALATTPKGLNWSNDAFTIANFKEAYENRVANGTNLGNSSNSVVNQNASMVNNAKIIQSTNPKNPDTSVIQMTNDKYQTGAVWSNMSKENYFDISHEQTASMWIYFGKVNGVQPADGMAFVLQKDPNGGNAIALSADGTPVNGQSLGVWGADWNYNNSEPTNLSLTAIQKSWALEFDTFSNIETTNITGEGTAFDNRVYSLQRLGQHIAGAYPADPKTYTWDFSGRKNFFYMEHGANEDVQLFSGSKNLVDSKWHHITIKWTPGSNQIGTLKYVYDDKDPNTGSPLASSTTTSFPIDTTKFGLTGDNKKLYWGFTGSTGKNYQNNLMIFESLPSFVDAEAKSSVYDDSQGGVQITDSNNLVDPNSDIRYTYALNYKGWTRAWDKINAVIKVPDNITYTSGTITYPDSPYDTNPRSIPAEAFQNIQDGTLTFQLPEALDSDSRSAQIELKGKTTKIAATELKVPSVHASFEGDNLITGTETQAFRIRARKLSLDSSSPNPIQLSPNEDVLVPGQVTYVGNTSPNYSNLTVHQTLNGMTSQKTGIVDNTGQFTLPITSDLLSKINTLSFYVTDNLGNTSNTVSRQINVGGLLSFGTVDPTVKFKPTHGSFEDKVIPRFGNWQIDVVDSRERGSNWTVQANSSNLVWQQDKKTPLKGNLIFRDSLGKDSDMLNNIINVASHTKDIDDPQTKNITDTWTANSGVLLSMKKGNPGGEYQGTIKWTLLDSI